MVVPNTTSSGVVFLARHDALNRILLNWIGVFCTKSKKRERTQSSQFDARVSTPETKCIGVRGWGLAFGHLAIITLTGLFILRRLGRAEQVSSHP